MGNSKRRHIQTPRNEIHSKVLRSWYHVVRSLRHSRFHDFHLSRLFIGTSPVPLHIYIYIYMNHHSAHPQRHPRKHQRRNKPHNPSNSPNRSSNISIRTLRPPLLHNLSKNSNLLRLGFLPLETLLQLVDVDS